MSKRKKWETNDLSRFAWEIVDTHTADQRPTLDWGEYVEALCAAVPDEEGQALTLQKKARKPEK